MIKTVEDVITALGGEQKLAESCEIGLTAVRNWKNRDGAIPATYFMFFRQLLKRRRMEVSPRVFNFYAPPPRRGTDPRQADQQDQSQVAS